MRTEAGKKRAQESRAKWNKANLATVGTNMKKDEVEAFRELAKRRGTTMGAMIKAYIQSELRAETAVEAQAGRPRYDLVTIRPIIGERLKAAAAHGGYTGSPDDIANMVLKQWLDAQEELRPELKPLTGTRRFK